jgi:hypothetical protein
MAQHGNRRDRYSFVNLQGETVNLNINGRNLWALQQLIAAGQDGCTPISHIGPRWSAYIFNLRELGVQIETRHERHDGPYSGTHARYILQSRVTRIQGGDA